MLNCGKCIEYDFWFSPDQEYAPAEFLEGKRNSRVLIVALNPKLDKTHKIAKTTVELEIVFDNKENIPSFFKDYGKVSKCLFDLLGRDHGAAHTDIVKCLSRTFPPENCGWKETQQIIENCKHYFEMQLKEISPELIICNGRAVCDVVTDIIKPPEDYGTSYRATYDGADVTVILSGFIGRIDDFAKRRLGVEIEQHMVKLGIA